VEGTVVDALLRMPLAEADDDVLARFHRELLQPAFPPAELMTLEELSAARREPSVGGLLLLDGDRPLAGMVTEDYLDGAVRLLGYLVVAAAARGRGLGAALVGELRPATPGGLVVAEIEDPRIHALSDAADPVARIRFYDRYGGRLLPLPYVQPSLRGGSPRVEGLLLITLNAAGDDVDGSVIAAFLDEYYALCEGVTVVRTDPAYLAMRAAAVTHPAGRLPLHALADLTAARPAPG
jgi:GNAT superfamily N-acetyltransferase